MRHARLAWREKRIEGWPGMNASSPELTLSFEATPNPRSRKVIADRPLRLGDPIAYQRATGAFEGGPLIAQLLGTPHITDLYLRGNVLTVTQDGSGSWYLLEDIITGIIRAGIDAHDPAYTPPAVTAKTVTKPRTDIQPSPQLDVIREILDNTITPYIESHGGAVELVAFDTETHRLTIAYEGACGTCPSSLGMTLAAIQNMLRDQYDPLLVVNVSE